MSALALRFTRICFLLSKHTNGLTNMDDTLEKPTFVAEPKDIVDGEDAQSSDDEDQGPDWTKIPYV